MTAAADRYGFVHAGGGDAALDAFAEATHALVSYRPTVAPAIARALDSEPDLTAAHALRGITLALAARPEWLESARAALDAARGAGPSTADEAALVQALEFALAGRQRRAADALERRLERNPCALLLVKLANMLRFQGGDLDGLARSAARVLPAWDPATLGYGYVLGLHAFAMEETGDYEAAERLGRAALEHAPDDAWSVHAVAHAHEMTARAGEGALWVEATRSAWSGCGGFGFHVAWHLALFHLEDGDFDGALAVYDAEVRPAATEDVRDVANASSLLWRLRQEGVAVGGRWEELAEIARRRRGETELLFASLHYLLALLAVGDMDAARNLVAAIGREAGGVRDQSHVARCAGLPLARALLALAEGGRGTRGFDALVGQLQRLGGSHAQRDVFVRMLADAAAGTGAAATLAHLRRARLALRRRDRFDGVLQDRLARGA